MLLLLLALATQPMYQSELIFPQEKIHNHASCIVELPNGDLFVTWYHGSGEREADDVIIEAARKVKGESGWRPRFLLADTPGFPDANPALFIDATKRLWLLWPVIIANQWETALMRYNISTDYQDASRAPRWDTSEIMLFKPDHFAESVDAGLDKMPPFTTDRSKAWRAHVHEKAADKYFTRMGWMTRVHPQQLPNGRIIVPLYSDGFSFSLMALSDDNGKNWTASAPLVGGGNIQPSVVRKNDGTLVAYMRDNGPPPKRMHVASSSDNGQTWTPPVDGELPNPGSGLEAIRLSDGLWAIIYNDTEKDRNSLAVSLSDDEGKTWKWTRHLEKQDKGQFHYPSIIQSRDGMLHASYSFYTTEGQAIKHATFNADWVKQKE